MTTVCADAAVAIAASSPSVVPRVRARAPVEPDRGSDDPRIPDSLGMIGLGLRLGERTKP
jgi:hypothetical protein